MTVTSAKKLSSSCKNLACGWPWYDAAENHQIPFGILKHIL